MSIRTLKNTRLVSRVSVLLYVLGFFSIPLSVFAYGQGGYYGEAAYYAQGYYQAYYQGSYSTTNVIYSAPIGSPTTVTNTGSILPTGINRSQISVYGDYAYLFGGFSSSGATNAVYRALLSAPTVWASITSTLPTALGWSRLISTTNDLYLFGGYNTNGANSGIYKSPFIDTRVASTQTAQLYTSGKTTYILQCALATNDTYFIATSTQVSVINPVLIQACSDTGSIAPANCSTGYEVPAYVGSGENALLTWSSPPGSTCVLSGPSQPSLSTLASTTSPFSVGPITSQRDYSLTCQVPTPVGNVQFISSVTVGLYQACLITTGGGPSTLSTFNSSGTWTVPDGVTAVDLLMVGGGGGGGGRYYAGGGGAGGVVYKTGYGVTPGDTITVTVGAGGAGGTASNNVRGSNGGSSSFATSTSISALGGGGGGSYTTSSGLAGGSGGGGSLYSGGVGGAGTAGQGKAGGNGGTYSAVSASYGGGAGGGGASAAGSPDSVASPGSAGSGGAGATYSISGATVTYGGGGGGGAWSAGANNGTGGVGGGGAGGNSTTHGGTAGTANTGGGGGGAYDTTGGDGGSGIVIIKNLSSIGSSCSTQCVVNRSTAEVNLGQSVDISWCCPAGVSSGSGPQGFTTNGDTSGATSTTPMEDSTYTVMCPSGPGIVSTVIVNQVPTAPTPLYITPPARVRSGNTVKLNWGLTKLGPATTCNITSNPASVLSGVAWETTWVGSATTSTVWNGSNLVTGPITKSTTFTLTCTNYVGTVSYSAIASILPSFQEK